MTTIDPGLEKQRKAMRPPGLTWIVISLTMLFLGGGGLALGILGTANQLVNIDLNMDAGMGAVAAMGGGIAMMVIGFISWSSAVIREVISRSILDEPNRFGFALGLAFPPLGGGLVLLYEDFLPWAWLTLAAAVLMLLASLWGVKSRKADARKAAELRASGQHTSAVVTDQGYDMFETGTASIFTTVTVSFHDHHGTQRWFTTPKLISRDFPIKNGQSYDCGSTRPTLPTPRRSTSTCAAAERFGSVATRHPVDWAS